MGHLNIFQYLKIHKYANFQPNPSEGDFLYIKADVLSNRDMLEYCDVFIGKRLFYKRHAQT